MRTIFKFFQKRKSAAILVLVILAASGYAIFRGKKTPLGLVKVERGDISQEVVVTGKTNPLKNVDLGFQQSGSVSAVYVDVGDKVRTGQVLVELDSSTLFADLKEAGAGVDAAQAKLAQLKRGARPEEILIAETKAANAKVALEDAKKNLFDKIQDAYTKSDDAVRNSVDQFMSGGRSSNPQLNFIIADSQLQKDVTAGRLAMEGVLVSWRSSLDDFKTSSELGFYQDLTSKNLNQVRSFLDKAALAINSFTANTTITQTTIDGWRSSVSGARTNINTAITNLSAAYEKFRAAQSNLSLEERNLALVRAGPAAEEIAATEAQVKEAEAKVLSIRTKMAQTVLRSPLSGVVTKKEVMAGEVVLPEKTIISIISPDNLQIESNVPEVDIGSIGIGNSIIITLDAFPGEAFSGRVIYIDPAETIVDGVVNYKIKIIFDKSDPRFKSGLTANLRIKTIEKKAVLTLPQYTIIEKDEGTFARVLDGKNTKDIKVTLGIRGRDGLVEIVSGVTEGQEVVNVGVKAK